MSFSYVVLSVNEALTRWTTCAGIRLIEFHHAQPGITVDTSSFLIGLVVGAALVLITIVTTDYFCERRK